MLDRMHLFSRVQMVMKYAPERCNRSFSNELACVQAGPRDHPPVCLRPHDTINAKGRKEGCIRDEPRTDVRRQGRPAAAA